MRQRVRSLAGCFAAALAVGAAPLLWAPEARADPYDGVYRGKITCARLPGVTGGDLRTAFSVTVAEGKATFEREILTPEGRHTGNFERGTGTVTPSGEMALVTRAAGRGFSYDAEYKGKFLADKSIRLMGGQSWQFDRRTGRDERTCFVDLAPVAPKR